MPFRALGLSFCLLAVGACASRPLAPKPSAPTKRAAVTLTYLGVAGWEVDDDGHALLIDPYFSRVDVADESAPLVPDAAAIARYAPKHADVILVEHSHYDHLLDVPTLALATGALVLGTESTLNVARAEKVPEAQLALARPGDTFERAPFSIVVKAGLHSLIGKPSTNIPRDVTMPMSASGYAEGGTLHYLVRADGRSILFISSANFIESELAGLKPDVAVVAVSLRQKIPDYTCRLMRALGKPPLVLTNHFDAHWQPLGPKQVDIDDQARAGLAVFRAEVHTCAPETRVEIPIHFAPISI